MRAQPPLRGGTGALVCFRAVCSATAGSKVVRWMVMAPGRSAAPVAALAQRAGRNTAGLAPRAGKEPAGWAVRAVAEAAGKAADCKAPGPATTAAPEGAARVAAVPGSPAGLAVPSQAEPQAADLPAPATGLGCGPQNAGRSRGRAAAASKRRWRSRDPRPRRRRDRFPLTHLARHRTRAQAEMPGAAPARLHWDRAADGRAARPNLAMNRSCDKTPLKNVTR